MPHGGIIVVMMKILTAHWKNLLSFKRRSTYLCVFLLFFERCTPALHRHHFWQCLGNIDGAGIEAVLFPICCTISLALNVYLLLKYIGGSLQLANKCEFNNTWPFLGKMITLNLGIIFYILITLNLRISTFNNFFAPLVIWLSKKLYRVLQRILRKIFLSIAIKPYTLI